jgi:ABC-2 type transport system permease protein
VTASVIAAELRKFPAFLRRDVLVAWTYRASFFSDWLSLGFQVAVFWLIGRMVDVSKLPTYGGTKPTYLEFAAVGIIIGAFVALALVRVSAALRQEQLTGTLESLLMTPTSPVTIQLGTVAYDLVYVPVRTLVFLGALALGFGLDFRIDGILPATLVLLAFMPFVWGFGVASAAALLTVRRGAGAVGLVITLLTLLSGAYFPLDLLPGWAAAIAEYNPITVAVDGMREALLSGADWSATARAVLTLAAASTASLTLGLLAFSFAVARERRLGTLGVY